VTSYTKYRRYPYPSSEREVGNGAAASEALARAVALDLDTLDAGWAAAPVRTSKILTLSANGTAGGVNVLSSITFNTVSTTKGSAGLASDGTGLRITDQTAAGWYYVNINAEMQATGAVTVNAKFELWLQQLRSNGAGTLVVPWNGERLGNTYYSTTTPALDNRVSGMLRLEVGDRVWCKWRHTNAASTARINQAQTIMQAVRVSPL
jgi:hypothetical protein